MHHYEQMEHIAVIAQEKTENSDASEFWQHQRIFNELTVSNAQATTVSCHRILGERRPEVIGRTWCR